ncbi:MAG: ribosomal-processing cysteine protease Prp [Lachnospiraceae bacterium]|nr:ribosomal-processing cysteine protease Prp [Lachnospiraceae bacterium]
MIEATFYLNQNDVYTGFDIKGHAGYAESGKDIICSAVSALSITTVNAIDTFTEVDFDGDMDPDGSIRFRITSNFDDKAQLLLSTLALGLTDISEEYGQQFLKVHYKEV